MKKIIITLVLMVVSTTIVFCQEAPKPQEGSMDAGLPLFIIVGAIYALYSIYREQES
jgi:hypothetical protein